MTRLIFFTLITGSGLYFIWPTQPTKPVRAEATEAYTIPSEKACLTYPHALVACGLHSMEELEAARQDDELRGHYRDIGIVQPAVLQSDEWDYVSFRHTGGIVWTPRKVLLRAGELVLKDKAGNRVRARCGNRISATPRTPAAFVIPPDMEREIPRITFQEETPPLIAQNLGKTPLPDIFPLPGLPEAPIGPFPAAPPEEAVPPSASTPRIPQPMIPWIPAGANVPPAIFVPSPAGPAVFPPARGGAVPEPSSGFLALLVCAAGLCFTRACCAQR